MTNIYIGTGDDSFPRAKEKQPFGVSTDRKQGRYCRGLHTLRNCLLECKRKSQLTRIVTKLHLGNPVGMSGLSEDKSILGGMVCEGSLERVEVFEKMELVFNRK